VGGSEDFLHESSPSTKEGLALMVLAEALLRVPDNATADRLIEDKLGSADFSHHDVRSDALLVTASAWALGLSARIIQAHETPETILASLIGRLGLPAVRAPPPPARRRLSSPFWCRPSVRRARGRHGALLVRHAGRGCAHRRGRGALPRRLRGRDRGDRPGRRQPAAPRSPGHLGQALGAAPALRGGLARARAARARAARDRAGA